MRVNLKNLLSVIISFSLGFFILYLVFRQQQGVYAASCDLSSDPYGCSLIKKTWADFTDAKWIYIIIAILFSFLSNIIRALRWNLLTEPLATDQFIECNSYWIFYKFSITSSRRVY